MRAANFMHELGHTLGLDHGGDDEVNCKPNYLSIMNYSYQTQRLDPKRPMTFSIDKLDTLEEGALIEEAGIGGPENRVVVYGVGFTGVTNSDKKISAFVEEDISYLSRFRRPKANESIDWNGLGGVTFAPIRADINKINVISGCGGEGEKLHGYNDWANLLYNVRDSFYYSNGVSYEDYPLSEEMTMDEIVAIAKSSDFDGDEISNFDDNCPAIHNPNQLDSDNDGVGDLCEADYNQCDITYDLPSNQWRQVSLPCDPGANNTVAAVFGDDNLGTNYTTDWVVYRYDTSIDNYVQLTKNDPLIQGVGYWVIQTTNDTQTLDMPDDSTPTSITHSTGCATTNGCFEVSLATQENLVQWNMIGYPFASTQTLGDDTKVVTNTGNCVSGCTLFDAEALKIVHNEFWTYNGTTYTKIGTGGRFDPWMGYWSATLKSAETNPPTLLVPKP